MLRSRIYMMTGVANLKEFDNAGLGFGTGDENYGSARLKIVPTLIATKCILLSRN